MTLAEIKAAAEAATRIRKALEPRVPDEHHYRCNSKIGEDCDCYAGRSNAAFEALDWLVERCEELAEAAKVYRDSSMGTDWGAGARLNQALARLEDSP